eukprot:2729380-Pleurochrysis_carterae.AAC.1
MRHATREGNKPSFWTYLKVNGCRGCRKQEEEETIHHVLSGGCEGIGRSKNNKYKADIRRAIGKYRKLMNDINNHEGVEQTNKALAALEWPRRQTDQRLKEEEELALKQTMSGIIPEWSNTDVKRKKGVIALLRLWTGEMMNCARIQMKTWITIKNEQKDKVQKRWDNRGKMNKAFQRWKTRVIHEEQGVEKRKGERD